MCASNVVLRKLKRVTERIIDVTLGSKVQDCADALRLQDMVEKVYRSYVALDKLDIRQMYDRFQILETRAIVKLIDYSYLPFC